MFKRSIAALPLITAGHRGAAPVMAGGGDDMAVLMAMLGLRAGPFGLQRAGPTPHQIGPGRVTVMTHARYIADPRRRRYANARPLSSASKRKG